MTNLPMTNWTDHPERPAIFSAHLLLTKAVLAVLAQNPDSSVLASEVKRMLDESLWAITEVKATPSFKGDQRYISAGVKSMFEDYTASNAWKYSGPTTKWHGRTDPRICLKHEHVIPRKYLREDLIAAATQPNKIERIMRSAKACLVTYEEDKRLPTLGVDGVRPNGWDRYQSAQIPVWDRVTGDWIQAD